MLAQLGMSDSQRRAADGEDRRHAPIGQTFVEHTIADHAGRAKNEHVHARQMVLLQFHILDAVNQPGSGALHYCFGRPVP